MQMESDPKNNVTEADEQARREGIHPGNAGLPFDVSFATLATYSVAGALLVQACGFVIATSYYTRVGVPAASIPLVTIWAAGASFAVITGYYFYIGAAVTRMSPRVSTWKDFRELLGYQVTMGIGLYFFLSIFFPLRWPGPGIYFAACGLLGAGLGKHGPPSYWFKISRQGVHFPDIARMLVPVVIALWLFSKAVFPNFPRAIGGGAPVPVVVQLSPDAPDPIPAGSRTYEVFSDSSFLYLEVALGKDAGPAQRDAGDRSDEEARDPFELPQTRYVQLPLSGIQSIRRIHPSSTPPPHDGRGSQRIVQ